MKIHLWLSLGGGPGRQVRGGAAGVKKTDCILHSLLKTLCSITHDNFLNLSVQKVLCYLITAFRQACFTWLYLNAFVLLEMVDLGWENLIFGERRPREIR